MPVLATNAASHGATPLAAIDEDSLTRLVEAFYSRVREDEMLGPVFEDAIVDWPEHLQKLQSFWSSVMLASGRYKGRPLPAHIKHGDRISAASFNRWLELWKTTTEELLEPGGAAILQLKAHRIAQSLRLGISHARGEKDALIERPAGP